LSKSPVILSEFHSLI